MLDPRLVPGGGAAEMALAHVSTCQTGKLLHCQSAICSCFDKGCKAYATMLFWVIGIYRCLSKIHGVLAQRKANLCNYILVLSPSIALKQPELRSSKGKLPFPIPYAFTFLWDNLSLNSCVLPCFAVHYGDMSREFSCVGILQCSELREN